MDEEPSWQRQLAVGVVALLIVGGIVGGIAAVIAMKSADYFGLGDKTGHATGPVTILPTTGQTPTHSAPTTSTPTTSPRTTHHTHKPPSALTLQASPDAVPIDGKITLSGAFPGHDGDTLRVQRRLAGEAWADFPATAPLNAGTFSTYIETGRTGVNEIRVRDETTGTVSNVVKVTVG